MRSLFISGLWGRKTFLQDLGSAPYRESDRGPRGILEPSTVICPKQWLKCFLNEKKTQNTKSPPPQKNTEKSWLSDGAVISILIEYTRTVREESKETDGSLWREVQRNE